MDPSEGDYPEGLSREVIAKARDVFTFFDRDRDGYISTHSVLAALRATGFNPLEKDVIDLLLQNETRESANDGNIGFKQFLTIVGGMKREGESEEEIDEAFRVFDRSGLGVIMPEDLRNAMMSFGERMTDAQVKEMIASVELGDKGEIQIKDLIKVMMSE